MEFRRHAAPWSHCRVWWGEHELAAAAAFAERAHRPRTVGHASHPRIGGWSRTPKLRCACPTPWLSARSVWQPRYHLARGDTVAAEALLRCALARGGIAIPEGASLSLQPRDTVPISRDTVSPSVEASCVEPQNTGHGASLIELGSAGDLGGPHPIITQTETPERSLLQAPRSKLQLLLAPKTRRKLVLVGFLWLSVSLLYYGLDCENSPPLLPILPDPIQPQPIPSHLFIPTPAPHN